MESKVETIMKDELEFEGNSEIEEIDDIQDADEEYTTRKRKGKNRKRKENVQLKKNESQKSEGFEDVFE